MNVSAILSAVQVSAAVNMLKSANRQPELALKLILESVQALPTESAVVRAPVESIPVSAPESPVLPAGQQIDIRV